MNKLDHLKSEISNLRNWEDVGSTHIASKKLEFRQKLLDIINKDDPTGEPLFESWCPEDNLDA